MDPIARLDAKLVALQDRFEGMDEKFGKMQEQLQDDIGGIRADLGLATATVTEMREILPEVGESIARLARKQDAQEQKLQTLQDEELANLKERVRKLEEGNK